jgi:hypothetical protein
MIKDYLPEVQKELEGILNEEVVATWNEREDFIERYFKRIVGNERVIYADLPKNPGKEDVKKFLKDAGELQYLRPENPYLIGCGEHQIVIGLNNGLIAKIHYKRGSDNLFSIGKRSFPHIRKTQNMLAQLGIQTPEMVFLRSFWEEDKLVLDTDINHFSKGPFSRKEFDIVNLPNICITTDLREEGHYKVIDYDGRRIKGLINKDEIVSQFENLTKILRELEENDPKIGIVYEPHFMITHGSWKEGIKKAIRKMFLVQIPTDPNEEGRLVVGDLDHVYIYPRSRGNTE